MRKKVPFKPKPQTSDEWVSAGAEPASTLPEPGPAVATTDNSPAAAAPSVKAPQTIPTPETIVPMKRLTIDIPNDLHIRIKMQCAARSRKMADEIRELLEERYGA